MIASWMLFSIATAVLIGVTAVAIEFIVIVKQRPARVVWLAAMVASVVVPVLAYMRAPLAVQAVAPLPQGGVAIGAATAVTSGPSLVDLLVSLDRPLLLAWILASVVLAVRLAHAMYAIQSRTRNLPRMTMRGVHIRESSDLGPAVVGIAPMEVVLPGWVRELDAPLRDLVLRHEDEHRSARDPYLLLAAAILAALMPWNIGLLWQVRRLRLAVEVDCDARVLRVHPDRERYGLLLLAVAQRRNTGSPLAATAMSEPASNLERRINAMKIASANISKGRLAAWAMVAAGAVALACGVDAPTRPAAQTTTDSSITLTPSQLKYASVSATMDSILDSYNIALKRIGSESAEYDSVRALLANLERAVGGGIKTVRTPEGVLTLERGTVPDGVITLERGTVKGASATATRSEVPTKVDPSTEMRDFQVEREAMLVPGTANPVYPPGLKNAGIAGEVIAQFVVGTDGKADLATFRVVRSTHALFTASVRDGLAQMVFTPATVGGRPVRQMLQLPFAFSFHQ